MSDRWAWVHYCRTLCGPCSQCGKRFSDRACGPTHAAIATARRQLPRRPLKARIRVMLDDSEAG